MTSEFDLLFFRLIFELCVRNWIFYAQGLDSRQKSNKFLWITKIYFQSPIHNIFCCKLKLLFHQFLHCPNFSGYNKLSWSHRTPLRFRAPLFSIPFFAPVFSPVLKFPIVFKGDFSCSIGFILKIQFKNRFKHEITKITLLKNDNKK